jgi:hypothetical protein
LLTLTQIDIASANGLSSPKNPPTIIESNFTLGASYMTFWGEKEYLGWYIDSVSTPLLGEYSSKNPVVADWHIKWMVEHGLSFLYLDFGWIRPGDYMDEYARKGLMKSQYFTLINISLFYFPDAVVGTDWATGESTLYSDFNWLAGNYFSSKQYQKIANQSVVIFPNFSYYPEEWGFEKTRTVFNELRERMYNNYGIKLYIIGAFGPEYSQSFVGELSSILNATTIWGYNTIIDYEHDITYEEYVAKNKLFYDNWVDLSTNLELSFVPMICPGFNNTPYEPTDPFIVKRNLTLFEEICDYSMDYATTPNKMILFFTWNDYHEGTSIEPTVEYEFDYLDKIRKIFTDAPENHFDEYPGHELTHNSNNHLLFGFLVFPILFLIQKSKTKLLKKFEIAKLCPNA